MYIQYIPNHTFVTRYIISDAFACLRHCGNMSSGQFYSIPRKVINEREYFRYYVN